MCIYVFVFIFYIYVNVNLEFDPNFSIIFFFWTAWPLQKKGEVVLASALVANVVDMVVVALLIPMKLPQPLRIPLPFWIWHRIPLPPGKGLQLLSWRPELE